MKAAVQHRILRDSALDLHHAEMGFEQQDEISGVSTIDWDQTSWMKSSLLHERAIKLSKSKSMRLFGFGAVSWRQNCIISTIWSILEGKLSGLLTLRLTVSWTRLLEKQSCSSGRFSQGTLR